MEPKTSLLILRIPVRTLCIWTSYERETLSSLLMLAPPSKRERSKKERMENHKVHPPAGAFPALSLFIKLEKQ